MFGTLPSTGLYPGYATLANVTVPTLSDTSLDTFPETSPLPALPLQAAYDGINTGGHIVIAADADGDGIADSLLFRIPGANFDGLTWYAAVRIIDNNSAINVNTAWTRDNEYSYPAGGNVSQLTNWGFFQSGVGLLEMLNDGNLGMRPGGDLATVPAGWGATAVQINPAFNQYRFNVPATENPPMAGRVSGLYAQSGGIPLDETWQTTFTAPQDVTARDGDFVYVSPGDAFEHQLIDRLDNPGFNTYTAGNPAVGNNRFQAIPFSDEAALAYHFGIPNSNTGQTLLESLLPYSLSYYQNNRVITGSASPFSDYNISIGGSNTTLATTTDENKNVPATPANATTTNVLPTAPYGDFPVSDVGTWWYQNFDYNTLANWQAAGGNPSYMPLRPLLVTRNPVSNYIDPVYDSGICDPQQPMDTLPQSSFPGEGEPLGQVMLPYYGTVAGNQYQGTWSATPPAGAYKLYDVVSYNGYYFYCLTPPGTGAAGFGHHGQRQLRHHRLRRELGNLGTI